MAGWRRSPLLAAQYLLTIAAGMGMLTAVVSLMLALGFRPLPYRNPGQLVAIWERVESGAPTQAFSGPALADFAASTHRAFTELAAFSPGFPVWLIDGGEARQIRGCYIEASAFAALGLRPVLGRAVRLSDQSTSPVGASTWISYRLWRNRYGGSPSVIGRTIRIGSSASDPAATPLRIAGVLPPRASIPLPFMSRIDDVWYVMSDPRSRPRQATVFFGLGRLRRGVSPEQAQAALTVVARRLGRRYPFERRNRPVVESLETIAQGPVRRTMGLLVLGVALVFLVGCVNLAILMIAEGGRRRREIAIRIALGANRARLWGEVAAEKCALTLIALALGAVIAFWLVRVLAQLVPAAGVGAPLAQPPPLDWRVLLAFAAFAVLAALVWSALLLRAASRGGTAHALAPGSGPGSIGRSDSSPHAGRWRLALLAGQTGVGICLLAAAALAARAYATQSQADLGPAPRRTLLMEVGPRAGGAFTDAQASQFNRQILTRLRRLPAVQALALADFYPPLGDAENFVRSGDPAGRARDTTSPISISRGFFRAVGIPVLYGRAFAATDTAGGEPVAIVNLEMAKSNWANPRQAVGSRIALGTTYKNPLRIVGVVANFVGYWSRAPMPAIYLPQSQSLSAGGTVVLRLARPSRAIAPLARQALAGMTLSAEVSDAATLQQRWQATLTRPLARMTGMLLLALLGLALSVQGVYAVAAATVEARTHELAVRSALGAPSARLIWATTRDLMLAVAGGAALGLAATIALHPVVARWLGALGRQPVEPLAVAIALLAAAAAAGCYPTARRATRANPAEILRQG